MFLSYRRIRILTINRCSISVSAVYYSLRTSRNNACKRKKNITDLNITYLNRMEVHSELTVSQNECTFTNDKAGS